MKNNKNLVVELMSDIVQQLPDAAHAVERMMASLLPDSDQDEKILFDAMRYGVMNGGKRIRPFLVMQSAALFDIDLNQILRVAAATEFLHCYSLIHDDLPCMDDAELRRGQKTVHKAFDEATALLAGDALLTLAFETLSDPETHPDATVRCNLIAALAKASGAHGMIGGQMLDLLAEKQNLNQLDIKRLQSMKTGALIEFSCVAGALLGNATTEQQNALQLYASAIGLAYQIVDDVLDATSSEAQLGKPTGQDQQKGKATFVSLWGLERARQEADLLMQQATDHLHSFGIKADPLRHLAKFLIARDY